KTPAFRETVYLTPSCMRKIRYMVEPSCVTSRVGWAEASGPRPGQKAFGRCLFGYLSVQVGGHDACMNTGRRRARLMRSTSPTQFFQRFDDACVVGLSDRN